MQAKTISEEPKSNEARERLKSQIMRCADCREEILQKNPDKCAFCGSANLISGEEDVPNLIAEIERLKRAGRYEDAALRYEELDVGQSWRSQKNG